MSEHVCLVGLLRSSSIVIEQPLTMGSPQRHLARSGRLDSHPPSESVGRFHPNI